MSIDRRELLLLLLYARGSTGKQYEPITGVTRMQKFLYLLKREQKIDKFSSNFFNFEAYKFGPYTSQLYDDLAFLQNLQFITDGSDRLMQRPSANVSVRPSMSLPPLGTLGSHSASRADIEEARIGYDYLLGGENNLASEDDLQERTFSLTEKGKNAIKIILEQLPLNERSDILTKVEQIKKYFGSMTLRQLLGYVYRNYPESAVESEIIDRVV